MKGALKRLATSRLARRFLPLWVLALTGSAHAIVTRHDVADSHYIVSYQSVPALANLPSEGHGTLIAPRWVVTAAHAVASMTSDSNDGYVTINGKCREVERVIFYPDYEASSAAWKTLFDQLKTGGAAAWKRRYDDTMASLHDIALLELRYPVNDVPAISIYRGSAEAGATAEIFGAGATGTDALGAADNAPHRGTLRRAENRITSAQAQWLRYVFDCGPTALPLEGVIAGGDSGGPLLIKVDGKWVLAGITHGMDGSLQDIVHARSDLLRQGVCSQTFASSRVSFYAHWIDQTMQIQR